MPDDPLSLLRKRYSVPVAAVSADGTPNVAPKSVMVSDPSTLVWGELYFIQTWENLRHHPIASLSVWETGPPFTACRVNGRAAIHEHDEESAALDRRSGPGTAASSGYG